MMGALLVLLCFLAGCSQSTEYTIPQELMYEGRPIHPSIIVATQFGDSSRYEPKSLAYKEDPDFVIQTEDFERKKLSEDISYDVHMHTVTFKLCYCNTFTYDHVKDTREHEIVDSYRYAGSYKGKYVVCGETYDTDSTGRFGFLGLIKREHDTIRCAGEIACGDRGGGGNIRVISLKNNLLRYAQSATYDMCAHAFTGELLGIDRSPYFSCGISIVYEVDLDSNINDFPQYHYSPHVVGLILDQEKYSFDESFYTEWTGFDQFDHYFCMLADSLVKEGKKELTFTEGQALFNTLLAKCVLLEKDSKE